MNQYPRGTFLSRKPYTEIAVVIGLEEKDVLPSVWKRIFPAREFLLSLRHGALYTRVHYTQEACALAHGQENRGCLRRVRKLPRYGRDPGANHLADARLLWRMGNHRLFHRLDCHAGGTPAAGLGRHSVLGNTPAGGGSLSYGAGSPAGAGAARLGVRHLAAAL